MKKLIALLLTLAAAASWAGDVARFVNLGFSEDDRYLLFGQYGVLEGSLNPYAEISVVDVPANQFAASGVRKASYKVASEPATTGEGALFNLLRDSADLVRKHGIDHVRTGRVLYVLAQADSKPQETLSFRDFQSGTRYQLKLVQASYGEGERQESTFHIEVTITSSTGETRSYRMGLPDYRRKGIRSYRVSEVLLSPRGGSLVAVIERSERDTGGSNIRYMIETLRLR
jgi:predicted secreted protein